MEQEELESVDLVIEITTGEPTIVYRLVKIEAVGKQEDVPRILPPYSHWPAIFRVTETVRDLPNVALVIPQIALPGFRVLVNSTVDNEFHEKIKECFETNGLKVGKTLYLRREPIDWPEKGTGDLLTEIERAGQLPF